MANSIDPRVARIIKYQTRAVIFNTVIASVGAILLASSLLEPLGAFFLALAMTWVFIKVLNKISLAIFQILVYGGNVDELVHDAEEAVKFYQNKETIEKNTPTQIALKIIDHPKKVFGRYMDAEFYEWIDVEDTAGKTHRFYFLGTMDISRGITREIPENSILFPPGIVYQASLPLDAVSG